LPDEPLRETKPWYERPIALALLGAVLSVIGGIIVARVTSSGGDEGPIATTATSTSPAPAVFVDGKSRTCEEMINAEGNKCDSGFLEAFKRWGANLADGSSAPEIRKAVAAQPAGSLVKLSKRDLHANFLAACGLVDRLEGFEQYDAYLTQYAEPTNRAERRLTFLAAGAYVCPELNFKDPGPDAGGGKAP
jgi:hypothetical protein